VCRRGGALSRHEAPGAHGKYELLFASNITRDNISNIWNFGEGAGGHSVTMMQRSGSVFKPGTVRRHALKIRLVLDIVRRTHLFTENVTCLVHCPVWRIRGSHRNSPMPRTAPAKPV
jgi:hypothetical protein